MPDRYKLAILLPLLKKMGLDLLLMNYRPVSNLCFVSKTVERAVAVQLIGHMKLNNLFEFYQSAYSEGKSTETALLRIQNDILLAMDRQEVTFVIMLDLSAAFDTVDYDILFDRLEKRLGVSGTVLQWIKSYLTGRRQAVSINRESSKEVELECGVPQGSVLGPILFLIYTLPLGDLLRKHGISYHMYADDKQIYPSFKAENVNENIDRIKQCLKDVDNWMLTNHLKKNGDKTEFLVIGTWQQQAKLHDISLEMDDCVIYPKDEVKNLGVILDSHLNMKAHATAVCKSAYFQLHNIWVVRQSLNNSAATKAIVAFVMSKLDSSNALLYGLPKCTLKRFQRIQDGAARCLTGSRKHGDELMPVLKDIHWLPVVYRIQYKLLVLTYKVLNGTGPGYLQDLLSYDSKERPLRTSKDRFLLKIPKTNLVTGGDRCFKKAAPLLWNSLPYNLRTCESLVHFKKGLKTHLFDIAFKDY